MFGLHESKKVAAMLVFLRLIFFFVESLEFPSETKTDETFFSEKCQTLYMLSKE